VEGKAQAWAGSDRTPAEEQARAKTRDLSASVGSWQSLLWRVASGNCSGLRGGLRMASLGAFA